MCLAIWVYTCHFVDEQVGISIEKQIFADIIYQKQNPNRIFESKIVTAEAK
jgi:hypothetical protein